MDPSTIKLHQSLLRHLKGLVSAYGEWIADQADEHAAAQLRIDRARLDNTEEHT